MGLEEDFRKGCHDIDGVVEETDKQVACKKEHGELGLLKRGWVSVLNTEMDRARVKSKNLGVTGGISKIDNAGSRRKGKEKRLVVWNDKEDYVTLRKEPKE